MRKIEVNKWRFAGSRKTNMWDVIVIDINTNEETGETIKDITTYPVSGETPEEVLTKWQEKWGDDNEGR